MRLFTVDFDKLARELLPVRLRRPRLLAFVTACLAPVKSLYARFLQQREDALYSLDHTSQVCHLQAALNDTFDPSARRIYIQDAVAPAPIWLRRRAEQQPVTIYRRSEDRPQTLYTRAEVATVPRFVVRVPSALSYNAVQMRALVDKYRLPTSVFTIQNF